MMKLPNWLRDILYPLLRPPGPRRRTIVCGGIKTPGHRKKRRHEWGSETEGTKGPEIVRRKIRPVRFPDDGIELAVVQEKGDPYRVTFWRWSWLYADLQKRESVRIDKNCHFGTLRGVDVLIAARREFRRVGIPVEVKLCGKHGFISLTGKNKSE